MRIVWSLPALGKALSSNRGDLVRARALIGGLRELGHDVEVVASGEQTADELSVGFYRRVIRRILPLRVALVLRDLGRWVQGRKHGRRIVAEVLRTNADLIIETRCHLATSGSFAAARTSRPLVIDDCSPVSEEIDLGTGLPALARRAFAAQVRQASTVVVSSHEIQQRLLADGVDRAKTRVVANGVDSSAYATANRRAARDRLGLGQSCVLCFLGSFQPWHRAEMLIPTLKALGASADQVQLLLIGAGPGLGDTVEAGRRAGLAEQIRVLGAVAHSEVPALLAAADIGVLPGTNSYGHPMKLVEYAAAALPAVAPDVPPVREVVQDGITGLLFRPGCEQEMASALRRLIDDPAARDALGTEAQKRVRSQSPWQVRAAALCE